MHPDQPKRLIKYTKLVITSQLHSRALNANGGGDIMYPHCLHFELRIQKRFGNFLGSGEDKVAKTKQQRVRLLRSEVWSWRYCGSVYTCRGYR
jgi:hypothetical protein